MSAPSLSVIIVNFNTRDAVMACVDSVKLASKGLDCEIFVIDNCSTDGSVETLTRAHEDIVVVRSPQNGGFAYGNAIGLQLATRNFVLMLNPDTVVTRDALEKSIAYLSANPDVGILGPRIVYPDGRFQNSVLRDLSLKTLFFIIFLPSQFVTSSRWLGDHRYASLDLSKINDVDNVMGSFMLTTRRVLADTGGLDLRFFMYGEECEWSFRVRATGRRVVYNPNIQIQHLSGESTRELKAWSAVEMAKGQLLFLNITRGKRVTQLAAFMMLARDATRWPMYALRTTLRRPETFEAHQTIVARLLFLFKTVLSPPKGQLVNLPSREELMRLIAQKAP